CRFTHDHPNRHTNSRGELGKDRNRNNERGNERGTERTAGSRPFREQSRKFHTHLVDSIIHKHRDNSRSPQIRKKPYESRIARRRHTSRPAVNFRTAASFPSSSLSK